MLRWIAAQPEVTLYTTSITQAEILHGLALLPRGKRRRTLQDAATATFSEDFPGRILGFGTDAAAAYAQIAADRRALGRPISQFDAQIAAIVLSAGATLATRNGSDFEGCGIRLVDPWTA
jgi:predicted nucleic acid-binding protein